MSVTNPSATNIAEDRTTCTTPRGTPQTASAQGPSLEGGRSRDAIVPAIRAVRTGGRRDREDCFFLPWVVSGILVSCVFAAQRRWVRVPGGRRWSSLATVEQRRTAQGRPSYGANERRQPTDAARHSAVIHPSFDGVISAAASRAFSRTFEAVLADNSAAVALSVTTSTYGHLQLHRAWPR